MTTVLTLVRVFLHDLVRRRALWIVLAACVAMIAMAGMAGHAFDDAIREGESFDVATRQAQSQLNGYAERIRQGLLFVGLILGIQMAPEARKNGTTQFALSVGASRLQVAIAQFAALGTLLTALTFVLHAGFVLASWRYIDLQAAEMLLGWSTMWLRIMGGALTAFSLSMTLSGVECLLLLVLLPGVLSLLRASTRELALSNTFLSNLVENLPLLFSDMSFTAAWPRLTYKLPATFYWMSVHELIVALLWVSVGYWLLRRHQYGSRTAVK